MWSTGVIVAEIEGNRNAPMHLDFAQEYFHDFALTENFVILGLSRYKKYFFFVLKFF